MDQSEIPRCARNDTGERPRFFHSFRLSKSMRPWKDWVARTARQPTGGPRYPSLILQVVLFQPLAGDFLDRLIAKAVPSLFNPEPSDGAFEHAKSAGAVNRVQ